MNSDESVNQTFTYPFIFRLIFRYGNIILTPVLILYSIPMIYLLDQKLILIIPLLVNLVIMYFLNRHYFNLYKIMPFKIQVDEYKITCSDFFLSKKKITIPFNKISSLDGGIFDNKISGLMKVFDVNNIYIGFYQRLTNSSKLVTIILSKVNRDIYDEVLEKIKSGKRESKK